jgi:hypothetical protein
LRGFFKKKHYPDFFNILLIIIGYVLSKIVIEKKIGSPCFFYNYTKQHAISKWLSFAYLTIATNYVLPARLPYKFASLFISLRNDGTHGLFSSKIVRNTVFPHPKLYFSCRRYISYNMCPIVGKFSRLTHAPSAV